MSENSPSFDVNRKYVRLIERRADGLVEFEFAIGDPELFVEMLLPLDAFDAFCRNNEVIHLPPREPLPGVEGSDWDWNLHQATHQRFR